MATSVTAVREYHSVYGAFVDDAGGGTSKIVELKGAGTITVQRISGAGTYTLEGSLDGVTFGALPTAIAAINDNLIKIVTGNPRYIRCVVAAAAATVAFYAVDAA